jgi:uncharacterized protein (DUF2236 family)
VWAGLLDYGGALGPAHNRLNRTAALLGVAAFGPRPDAERVARRVRDLHERTRGRLKDDAGRFPAGTEYAADDPALLLWVLTAIADSALAVQQQLVRRLTRDKRDAVWQDYRVLGAIFGLDARDSPDTIEDLDSYVRAMVGGPDLHVGADTRRLAIAAALRLAVTTRERPLRAVIRLVTVGLLPPALRAKYGLSWGPARESLLRTGAWCVRRAVPWLPEGKRYVKARGTARPLLAGDVRREGDAVVVSSDGAEVRVEGEPDRVRAVMALCDGNRSLEEILGTIGDPAARGDVLDLIEALFEHGVLRDVS